MIILHSLISLMIVSFCLSVAANRIKFLVYDWDKAERSESWEEFTRHQGKGLPPRIDYGANRNRSCPSICILKGIRKGGCLPRGK